MSRSTNYCFTLNNYHEKPALVAQLDSLDCKYMKYGREIGEEGTPHLQGLIIFNSKKSLKQAITALEGCHVEIMKSLTGSIAYCSKDGDVVERGIAPMSQSEKGIKGEEYYANLLKLARENRIQECPPSAQLTYGRALRYERDEVMKKRKLPDTEMKMLWYHGGPGTGKSRKARQENPNLYDKNCNKWWCGYTGEDVVLIDDFDKRHDVLVHHLKRWGDRYPFLAEHKGGATVIRPSLIIVTSNYHPSEIWTENSDLEPILRRFECVNFNSETVCTTRMYGNQSMLHDPNK